jgi:conjugative relaxase-like TrwC/TraI family protein
MIHPRRLKGAPGNIARYYAVGDYYTKGGEEPSQWGGAIASDLGLEGKVDPEIFRTLLTGKLEGQQLGRHRTGGTIEHHPGWDFAVNAPKSVSIMALVGKDERVLASHERAVDVALSYLEEHAALRRRVDGEVRHETTGRLLFARFTEHASRELDPHLHTHVVVLNMTNAACGDQMASLETRAMYAEQMVAGQVYRNELARDLHELGYQVVSDPRKGSFEIVGVPGAMIAEMSQRAEQIDAHAAEHGLTGQAGRRRSFYATRRAKEKTSLEELTDSWTVRAKPHLAALEDTRARAATAVSLELQDAGISAAHAMLYGIRQAETGEAVNNLGRMLRLALASHVGEVRLSNIRPLADQHEAKAKLLATREPTGDHTHTRGRTTRRTARLELALAQHLALGIDDIRPIAGTDRLLAALERLNLTPAQEMAVAEIATSSNRITGIRGVAGAGKSTLVGALRQAADVDMTLIALAPTSSAAANLGDSAGIESRTVASLLAAGGRGVTDRHVLVLDEAGQLGTRQALRVLEISRRTGAPLILLGDNRQTGAIEQGKAFWLLQRLGLQTVQLSQSLRQETRSMKAAVMLVREGHYAAALGHLDKVVTGDDAEALARDLVSEWTRLAPESRATTNILVLDNDKRQLVNAMIRGILKNEGSLRGEDIRLQVLAPAGMTDAQKMHARFYSGGQVVTFSRDNPGLGLARDVEYRVLGHGQDKTGRHMIRLIDENGRIIRWDPRLSQARQVNVFNKDDRALAVGDRIQWRLVSRELGLKNAERGTVLALDGSLAAVRWDRQAEPMVVDLAAHKTWDHGYAETVYSAQSKTYARAYLLAPVGSGLVNGQNFYTAVTRARFGVKLWTESTDALIDKLERYSGEKSSSLEGLGRLDRNDARTFGTRQAARIGQLREQQQRGRQEQRDRRLTRHLEQRSSATGVGGRLMPGVQSIAQALEDLLDRLIGTGGAKSPLAVQSKPGASSMEHDQDETSKSRGR